MGKLKSTLKRAIPKQKKKPNEIPPVSKKKTFYRYKLEFTDFHRILFVGEANFSFSLSIANRLNNAENLTCTAYDSKEITTEKYADALENAEQLMDLDATILYDIDCLELHKHFKKQRFHKIVFNFPHVGLGIKDQNENVLANQKLISGFFNSSKKILTNGDGNAEAGVIIISVKTGIPYDLWNVKLLAKDCGLKLVRSLEFVPSDYQGYAHRRTIGHDTQKSSKDNAEIIKNPSRTFIFKA